MRKFALLSILIYACAQSGAQTTTVQQLGAVPVSQPASGLGFNVDATNDWEFQQAAAAGAKHVRFGCSWGDAHGGHAGGAELQSAPPNNVSQGYTLASGCAQAIASAKKYGLTADITAIYGPPYQQILALNVTSNAAVGATSVQVSFASGVGGLNLSSIQFPYDYLYGSANYGEISYKHSYPGTLITSVSQSGNSGTINLASALQVPLTAGTPLLVNRVLYPSAASNSPTDPSVLAYIGYVKYLGSQCSAAGASCQIGLWNEPAWPDDCWDNRGDCYDNNPGYNEQNYGPNYGFVAALQATTASQGVTYSWAGTDKSGDNSVLGGYLKQYTGTTFYQTNNPITAQSSHPYGNNPEDNMWNWPCTLALPKTTNMWGACNTLSTSYSNADEVQIDTLATQATNSSFKLDFDITETGFSLSWGDAAHQARYIMRQYLGFIAGNVKVVDFMDLYDCDLNFGMINQVQGSSGCNTNPTTAGTPRPSYTALSGLESDLAAINHSAPTSYTLSTLPSVASYTGTYPLQVMHMVGAANGAAGNSDYMALWQLSNCNTNGCWSQLGSPTGAPLVINIPSGMQVVSAINLDTRAAVSYTTSGQQIKLSVSDDPIAILVQASATSSTTPPTSSVGKTTLTLTGTVSGTNATFTSSLSPNSSGSATTNGENIFFYDGSIQLGHAPMSNGVATLVVSASALPSGTSTALATYGGDGTFYPSTATTSVTSTTKTSGPSFTVTASTSGSTTTFTSTLSPYTSGSATTNGENIFFYNGSVQLGHAAMTSGVATLAVPTSTLASGSSTVLATYGGDGNINAATATVAVSR